MVVTIEKTFYCPHKYTDTLHTWRKKEPFIDCRTGFSKFNKKDKGKNCIYVRLTALWENKGTATPLMIIRFFAIHTAEQHPVGLLVSALFLHHVIIILTANMEWLDRNTLGTKLHTQNPSFHLTPRLNWKFHQQWSHIVTAIRKQSFSAIYFYFPSLLDLMPENNLGFPCPSRGKKWKNDNMCNFLWRIWRPNWRKAIVCWSSQHWKMLNILLA